MWKVERERIPKRPFLYRRSPWGFHLIITLFVIYAMLTQFVPFFHRFSPCDTQPWNDRHVFMSSISLSKTLGTRFVAHISQEYPFPWSYADSEFQRLIREYDAGSQIVPRIADTATLQAVWIVWYPLQERAVVAYLDQKVHGSFFGVDTLTRAGRPIVGFVVPYRRTGSARENIDQMHALAQKLLDANRRWCKTDPSVAIALLDQRIWKHVENPAKDSEGYMRMFLGSVLGLFELSFTVYTWNLRWRGYRRAREQYRRLRQQGYRGRSPSLIVAFVRWYREGYPERYTALATERLKRQKNRQRNLRREDRRIADREAFALQVMELEADLAKMELSPSAALRDALGIVRDDSANLKERRNAYWDVRRLLAERTTADDPLDGPSDYEDQLRREATAISLKSMSKKVRSEYTRLMQESRSSRRVAVRIWCLERALSIVVHDEEAQHTPHVVKKAPESAPAPRAEEVILNTWEDFVTLLNINGAMPRSVDHLHASAILLTGILKTTQRGRRAIGKRYRTAQYVREDVASKLRKSFDPELYDQALGWLVSNGVIIIPKKTTAQIVYSLNPHDDPDTSMKTFHVQVTPEGSEVIRRVHRFMHIIDERETAKS